MPTEPLAAVLYISLLLPGIAFLWSYEGHASIVKRSVFRETAIVVVASAASLLSVLVLHHLLSFAFEPISAVVRQFFTDPAALFRTDSQLFLTMVFADLALAVALGFFYGSNAANRMLKKGKGLWYKLQKKDVPFERGQSGWNAAFEMYPDHKVVVGVYLKSGAWLQGTLKTWTHTGEETGERALTLTHDLLYRSPDSEIAHPIEGYSIVVVQASEIDYLTVGYVEADTASAGLPEQISVSSTNDAA